MQRLPSTRRSSRLNFFVDCRSRAARQEYVEALPFGIERRRVRAFLGRHPLGDAKAAPAVDDVDQAWLADGHVDYVAQRVEPDGIRLAIDRYAAGFLIAREIEHDDRPGVAGDERTIGACVKIESRRASHRDVDRGDDLGGAAG